MRARRYLVATLVTAAALAQGPVKPGEVTIATASFLPLPTYRAAVNDVEVEVVVRDRQGKPVAGLPEEDFELLDEGQPQKLTGFAEIDAPGPAAMPSTAPVGTAAAAAVAPAMAAPTRSVALYFDDLHTDSSTLGRARMAAQKFVDSGLPQGARFGVFTGSNTVTLGFSADAAQITAALSRLRARPRMEAEGADSCPRITPEQAYNIVFHLDQEAYDLAVTEAYRCNCVDEDSPTASCRRSQAMQVTMLAQQLWEQTLEQSQVTLGTMADVLRALAAQPGERVLVLTSGGFLTGTLETEEDQLIDDALRAGVVIDGLDARGLVATEYSQPLEGDVFTGNGQLDTYRTRVMNRDLIHSTDGMAALAAGTGGRLFWNNNDLEGGFRGFAAPPDSSYELAFTPADASMNGKFHKLTVKLTVPENLTVQARKGYYAAGQKSAPAAAPAAPDTVETEALGADLRTELPVTVTPSPAAGQVLITEHIDTRALQFAPGQAAGGTGATSDDALTVAAVLFNAAGRPAAGKRALIRMHLSAGSLARLESSGISTTMTLDAPAGDYRLRVITRDEGSGKMAAASYPVHLP